MSLSIRVYSLIITNETYLEAWKNHSICSTVAYFNLINFILKDEEFIVVLIMSDCICYLLAICERCQKMTSLVYFLLSN